MEHHLKTAQPWGNRRQGTYRLALLAVMDGQSLAQAALLWRGPEKTVAAWGRLFCCDGLQGPPRTKPTGRPPPRPPPQTAPLATRIDEGPVQAGCRGACWRSPRLPQRMYDRCGVFSHGFSSAPWLKNLGFRSQKAAGVSAPRNAEKRQVWRTTTGPQMLHRAQERKALRLGGAEASFPPWGTRTYTWTRRGQPPKVKPSGKRQGSTVFGVMASCTGRLFSQGQEGRLTSTASLGFLKEVLEQTTPPSLLLQEGAR